MDQDTFIVATYCLIDDLFDEALGDQRLRERGPRPAHDRWVAEYDLLAGVGEGSVLIGDSNYWSPLLREDLARYGVELLAPKKTSKKRLRHPWPAWLTAVRRRIETVVSQLVERATMPSG